MDPSGYETGSGVSESSGGSSDTSIVRGGSLVAIVARFPDVNVHAVNTGNAKSPNINPIFFIPFTISFRSN